MFLDFVALQKSLKGESLVLDHCEFLSEDIYGWKTYRLQHYCTLRVKYNVSSSILKIEGSLPYFWQGHNLHYSSKSLESTFSHISELLKIELNDAQVSTMEFGTVWLSDYKFDCIKQSHFEIEGFEVQIYGSGKYFVLPNKTLKIYNANKTVQAKVKKVVRDQLKRDGIFRPEQQYVKVENKYTDPKKHFGREIFVADLLTDEFSNALTEDLISTYESVKKQREILLPSDKREITPTRLMTSVLYEYMEIRGDDPKQFLLTKLNSLPQSILSKQNKSTRKKVMENVCDSIVYTEKSKYDLLALNSKPFWFAPFLS